MTSNNSTLPDTPEEVKFQTGRVIPVITGHFVHDLYASAVPPLLPLIIEKLSLSLTQAGFLNVFLQVPGILNPLFGYLSDKASMRYLLAFAPAITASAISLMGLAPNYYSLAFLLFIAGISSATFHAPAPAMVARSSGRKVGLGMSLFMAAGDMAFALGPLFAVWAVTSWTLEGIWRIMVLGWVTTIYLFLHLSKVETPNIKPGNLQMLLPYLGSVFLPVAIFNLLRFPLLEGLSTFLPTYMITRGASLWMAGGSLTIIMSAGVLGVLSVGTVSDRLGRKPVLIVIAVMTFILTILFLYTRGWVSIVALFLLGFFFNSNVPVILALVQENFPQNRATANGIYMATNFFLRPIGTLIIGFLGDNFGLEKAIFWGAVISILSIGPILRLPDRSHEPDSAPAVT